MHRIMGFANPLCLANSNTCTESNGSESIHCSDVNNGDHQTLACTARRGTVCNTNLPYKNTKHNHTNPQTKPCTTQLTTKPVTPSQTPRKNIAKARHTTKPITTPSSVTKYNGNKTRVLFPYRSLNLKSPDKIPESIPSRNKAKPEAWQSKIGYCVAILTRVLLLIIGWPTDVLKSVFTISYERRQTRPTAATEQQRRRREEGAPPVSWNRKKFLFLLTIIIQLLTATHFSMNTITHANPGGNLYDASPPLMITIILMSILALTFKKLGNCRLFHNAFKWRPHQRTCTATRKCRKEAHTNKRQMIALMMFFLLATRTNHSPLGAAHEYNQARCNKHNNPYYKRRWNATLHNLLQTALPLTSIISKTIIIFLFIQPLGPTTTEENPHRLENYIFLLTITYLTVLAKHIRRHITTPLSWIPLTDILRYLHALKLDMHRHITQRQVKYYQLVPLTISILKQQRAPPSVQQIILAFILTQLIMHHRAVTTQIQRGINNSMRTLNISNRHTKSLQLAVILLTITQNHPPTSIQWIMILITIATATKLIPHRIKTSTWGSILRPMTISRTHRLQITMILFLMISQLAVAQPKQRTQTSSPTKALLGSAVSALTPHLLFGKKQKAAENTRLDAEKELQIEHDNIYRGDSPQTKYDPSLLTIETYNIGGGISKPDKWDAVVNSVKHGAQDIVVLTETGDKNTRKHLQYLTREYTAPEKHMYRAHREALPYLIYSINSKNIDGDRGGITLLVHERWKHRIQGQPRLDPLRRWISIRIHTPHGKTTVIGTYQRPSPQQTENKEKAKLEWASLKRHILQQQTTGHSIIIAGDFNASLDLSTHRDTLPRGGTSFQHNLLTHLLENGQLTHTYMHRHHHKEYYTRTSLNKDSDSTRTSPDHILYSNHEVARIAKAGVDDTPNREQNRDHSRVYASFYLDQAISTPPITHPPKLTFDIKRKDEYSTAVEKALANTTTPADNTEKGEILFKMAFKSATKIFGKKPHQTHKSRLVAKLNNHKRCLRTLYYHTRTGTPPPLSILQKHVIRDLPGRSLEDIEAAIKQIENTINSKSRKRRARAQINGRNYRSNTFANKNYNTFLKTALSKASSYRGIVGVLNETDGSIDTTAETVKATTQKRMFDYYYKSTNPAPAFITNPTKQNWNSLPPVIKDIFHPTYLPEKASNPIFTNMMRDASIDELQLSLKKMGRNKAPGPSKLTVEMLRHLSPAVQQTWLLPFINQCLQNRDAAPFTKIFNVWPTEKRPGMGSILRPGKLQVRPISLLEVPYKLLESIIYRRLMRAMTKANYLHPQQYAFTPNREVKQSILQTIFLMEDARHNRKECHLSNNDCSAAYDSCERWAMSLIYRHHGFPPELSQFLTNMHTGQMGQILTGHGATEQWEKECGLGQGSLLAPLQWNLLLDPIIRHIDSIKEDAYTIDTAEGPISISISSFADDTTLFSSTHKGYLKRFTLLSTYLATFGISLSPEKTKYQYNSPIHRESAIAVTPAATVDHGHSDHGTTTPSMTGKRTNTASPDEALRHLGAYLSLTGNWKTARQLLFSKIESTMDAIKYKRLEWIEVRYIVTTVIQAQVQYYALSTPLSLQEMQTLDSHISQKFRSSLKLASTTNAHTLYMDDKKSYGYGLPSITDINDQTLLQAAQTTLKSNTPLGSMARHSLLQYREAIQWTSNPLDNTTCPHKPPPANFWFSRVREAMDRQQVYMQNSQECPPLLSSRTHDVPLHTALNASQFRKALPLLRTKNWKWIGDISNALGTKINTRLAHESNIWTELQTNITNPDGTLKYPVSPTKQASQMGAITAKHPNNSIVLKLRTDQRHIFNFYRIIRTFEDADNAECVEARPLQKHKKVHTHFYHNGKQRTPILTAGTPGYYDDKTKATITEFADAFVPIKHTWIKITKSNADKSNSLLITTNQNITFITSNLAAAAVVPDESSHPPAEQTNQTTIAGSITNTAMISQYTNYQRQFYRNDTDGLVYKLDQYDTRYHCFSCSLAGHRGTDMQKCTTAQCYHHIHNRCHADTLWQCPAHTPIPPPPHTIPELTPEEHHILADTNCELYSASDGSVVQAGTGQATSTFGIAIKTTESYVTRRGKFRIRQGDESSYRAELEGIIWAYKIIPNYLATTHAVDNTAAINTHAWLLTKKERPTYDECRRKKQYITAIQRLWDAMQHRDPLHIIHTKSHEEQQTTENIDLRERRNALAQADKAAGEAHKDTELQNLNDSSYTLHHNGEALEKKPLTSLKHIAKQNHHNALKNYSREGQSLSLKYPPWDTGSKQWPTHLQRLRHLLLIQRLPTAETRWKRYDKVKTIHRNQANEPLHPEEATNNRILQQGNPNASDDEISHHHHAATETMPSPRSPPSSSSSSSTVSNEDDAAASRQRADDDDDGAQRISPLCPICKNEIFEDHIQDIPHHLSTCYLAKVHLPSLEQKLSTALGSKAPIYSPDENQAAFEKFQETKKVHPQISGHVHPKGIHMVKVGPKTMRTQWYNKAIHEADLNKTQLQIHQTLAPPLLESLHSELHITMHIGGIRANPHSTIPTEELSELENLLKSTEPQTFLIQNEKDPINKYITLALSHPQHKLVILSPSPTSETHNGYLKHTIDAKYIRTIPETFWRGYYTGLETPTTDWHLQYPTSLDIQPTIKPDYSILTTPTYITQLLSEQSPEATAFLSAGIHTHIIQSLKTHGIPEKYHRKLYKTLGKTIIEHQYEVWVDHNSRVPHLKTIKKKTIPRPKRSTTDTKQNKRPHSSTVPPTTTKHTPSTTNTQTKPIKPKKTRTKRQTVAQKNKKFQTDRNNALKQQRILQNFLTKPPKPQTPLEPPPTDIPHTAPARKKQRSSNSIPPPTNPPKDTSVPQTRSTPKPLNCPLPNIPRQMKLMRQPLPPDKEEKHLRHLLRPTKLPDRTPGETVVMSGRYHIDRNTLYTQLTRNLKTPLTKAQQRSRRIGGNIIDSFLNQIAVRASTHNHRMLCLPTYIIVLERDPTRVWDTLQSTTLKGIDLTSINTILIPINLKLHWMLAHIDIDNKEIAIYDSHYNKLTQTEYSKKLCSLLAAAPGLKNTKWQTRKTADFPQQTNKYDSGLFTCAAALCIGTKKSMIFSHKHMNNFRLALADSLLRDKTSTSHTTALKSTSSKPFPTIPKPATITTPKTKQKTAAKPTTSPSTPTSSHKPIDSNPSKSSTPKTSKVPKTTQPKQQIPQVPHKTKTPPLKPTTPQPAAGTTSADSIPPTVKPSTQTTSRTTLTVPTFFQIGYKPNPPPRSQKRKKKSSSTVRPRPAKPTPKKRSRSEKTTPETQEQDKVTPPAKRRRRRPENYDAQT